MKAMDIQKLLILLIITLSMASCSKKKETVIYNLVDNSSSTDDSLTRSAYLEDFNKIISKSTEGDIVMLNKITANSVATSSLFEMTIPENSIFSYNKDTYKQAKDSALTVLNENCGKYFDEAQEEETDIINSILEASRILKNEQFKDKEKIMVIYSDMIQESSEVDFTESDFNSKKIDQILEKLKNDSRIAYLNDIHVYIIGACFSPSGSTAPSIKKTGLIKTFWSKYFAMANAKFNEQNYNARLTFVDMGKEDSKE